MNAIDIIRHFYPEDTPLRRLLLLHSTQVRDKALSILGNPDLHLSDMDVQMVNDGALLHDIGIMRCQAPSILCEGTADYLHHGVLGAQMLREYGKEMGVDMEAYARICERHTGTGLSKEEVVRLGLPVNPPHSLEPETLEEKLICLADKFYSKSSPDKEKPMEKVRASLAKFGDESVARFDELCNLFKVI